MFLCCIEHDVVVLCSGSLSQSADVRLALITPASLLSRLGHNLSRKRNPKVPAAEPVGFYMTIYTVYSSLFTFVLLHSSTKTLWVKGGRPVNCVETSRK